MKPTALAQPRLYLFNRSFLNWTAAATLCLLTAQGRAASIGVDFGDAAHTVGSGALAGAAPYAQTNYNSVGPAFSSTTPLNDNGGLSTPTTLTLTPGGGGLAPFFYANTVAGGDEALNNGGLNAIDTWSFSLANIPYASYSIVVYDLEADAGVVKGIGLGNTTYYTSSPGSLAAGYVDNNAATPFIYTRGISTNSSAPTPQSDYVLFPGLTGSTQTVTITELAPFDGRVTGFQVVQTPEPSTWLLLLLGGGLLLACLARRRSAS